MVDRAASTPIGDIVASDFRTAAIFDRFGIDFCCGGRRPFDEACRAASADPSEVARALDALPPATPASDDPAGWSPDALVDHIVSTHHRYVRASLPVIAAHLDALIAAHGGRHPELRRVAAHFARLSADLEQHMAKEEQVLFPYVRELAMAAPGGRRFRSPFGTVENPIRMMEREHRDAGDEMRVIRELTGGYQAPPDGCTTYQVCMAELEQFEHDLHRHVHLENNVLFPKAIDLENGY